jgi:hypothetical protein
LSFTFLMRALPTAQPELHRHGLVLNRQILKAAVGPAMAISASPSAIGANAKRWSGSGNNPTVIISARDTQNFDPWARRPFRFRAHARALAASSLTPHEPHKLRKTPVLRDRVAEQTLAAEIAAACAGRTSTGSRPFVISLMQLESDHVERRSRPYALAAKRVFIVNSKCSARPTITSLHEFRQRTALSIHTAKPHSQP